MSSRQVKIHQDQEDKLPFNGENGNSFLRDQDDLVTSQQEQVNNKKACSKIPRKLQGPHKTPFTLSVCLFVCVWCHANLELSFEYQVEKI